MTAPRQPPVIPFAMKQGWQSVRLEPWMLRRAALFLAILMSGGNLLIPRLPMLGLLLVLCLGATSWRLPLRRRLWPAVALLVAVLLLTMVRPGPLDALSLLTRYANFGAALMLLNVYVGAAPGTLQRDLLAILWPLALQAIATVVLAHTVGSLFLPVAYKEAIYQSFLFVFNYHVTVEIDGGLVRPDGFFYEPGVFQAYLNLYLYLALFVARNRSRSCVATLAVLSTQSTTGLAICLVLLGTAFLQHTRTGSPRRKALVLLIAALLTPPLLYVANENVQEKLYGEFKGSSWAREYDLFTGLNILLEHPLLGIGFDVDRYTAAAAQLGYDDTLLNPDSLEDRTTSNGLLQMFTSLGLPMGLVFCAGVLRQRLFRHRWLIALWFTLSMGGEALVFTPFFMLIVFSAFTALPQRRAQRQPRLAPLGPAAP